MATRCQMASCIFSADKHTTPGGPLSQRYRSMSADFSFGAAGDLLRHQSSARTACRACRFCPRCQACQARGDQTPALKPRARQYHTQTPGTAYLLSIRGQALSPSTVLRPRSATRLATFLVRPYVRRSVPRSMICRSLHVCLRCVCRSAGVFREMQAADFGRPDDRPGLLGAMQHADASEQARVQIDPGSGRLQCVTGVTSERLRFSRPRAVRRALGLCSCRPIQRSLALGRWLDARPIPWGWSLSRLRWRSASPVEVTSRISSGGAVLCQVHCQALTIFDHTQPTARLGESHRSPKSHHSRCPQPGTAEIEFCQGPHARSPACSRPACQARPRASLSLLFLTVLVLGALRSAHHCCGTRDASKGPLAVGPDVHRAKRGKGKQARSV